VNENDFKVSEHERLKELSPVKSYGTRQRGWSIAFTGVMVPGRPVRCDVLSNDAQRHKHSATPERDLVASHNFTRAETDMYFGMFVKEGA
jgi:hypothetical protein